MEQHKNRRTILRRQATRSYNSIMLAMENENPDLEVILADLDHLKEIQDQLEDLNSKIMDLLFEEEASEEQLEKDSGEAEDYKRRYFIIKRKVEAFNNKIQISSIRSIADGRGSERSCKLPKLKLKTFSGELKDWLAFWSQFEKIHGDKSLHDSDKFQYLIMAMEPDTVAKEIVESYPQTGDNYAKVIEALKARFGDEDLLLQVYVRELLKLVISNANAAEKIPVQQLYLKIESHLRSLKTLNLSKASPDTWIFPLIESSVPSEILLAWQRSATAISGQGIAGSLSQGQSRLEHLMEFLKREVQINQKIELAQGGFEEKAREISKQNENRSKKKEIKKEVPATLSNFQNTEFGLCVFCGKNHESKECVNAQTMTLQQKKEKLKENHCCLLCFKANHIAKNCRTFLKCVICHRRHHVLMCPEGRGEWKSGSKKSEVMINNKNKVSADKSDECQCSVDMSNNDCYRNVLLQTIMIKVCGNGKSKVVRAFLDSGSQRSYIRTQLAQELQLEPFGEESVKHSLFGGATTKSISHKLFSVTVQHPREDYSCNLKVRSQIQIANNIPRISNLNEEFVQELKQNKIWLSDSGRGTPNIEILIGADFYAKLLTGKMVEMSNGMVATETFLGWALSGEMSEDISHSIALTDISMSIADNNISRMWDLETIGVRDPIEVQTAAERELQVKQLFFQSLSREKDGRYTAKLPWKKEHPPLPTNREVAERRLKTASQKLIKANQFKMYGNIFEDWLKEEFIEEVPDNEEVNIGKIHYLPHRPVFKPESLTTPVRPVFDASCKLGRQASLNDCLEKGTSYIQMIPELLLRFREKEVGFVADIRKAFQMINVHVEDRDVLRFLWWEDETMTKMKIYRHARVMFGATSSPFTLGAVLEYHLKHVKEEDKKTALMLLKSFYVDNCVLSLDHYEEYFNFKEKATSLLKDAQMDLRLWMSNVDSVMETKVTSVLGLKWNREEDTLFVDLSSCSLPEVVTKRNILSAVQKVFDPIGFTAPATISMKILLQDMWLSDASWDAALPKEIERKFRSWYSEVNDLMEIHVPRLATSDSRSSWNLHIFTDASQRAYAASVLLKTENQVHLLAAKARVAPIKKATIPRLELLGCLIGSYLGNTVKSVWNLTAIPCYYWTDSTAALAWIRREDSWATFVSNRVAKIRQLTEVNDWHHIPGSQNHADFLTRGCSPTQLLKSRWWVRPLWLKMNTDCWPKERESVDEEVVEQEKRKTPLPPQVTTICITEQVRNDHTYSQYIRIKAWTLRFIANCRKGKTERVKEILSKEELKRAELALIKEIQQTSFTKHEQVPVPVVLDEEGILHVKTKIILREDLLNFKFPILLPKSHPLVTKLIEEIHIKNCHAGVGCMMGLLRENFWIIQSRRTIQKVLKRCKRCNRFKAKPTHMEMAPLPVDRVKDAEVFQTIGVDLAGPLILKTGGKVWIVIFTCAVYRAVHLEVIPSLSTKAFIQAMFRFVRKYRRPEVVYSDNGTNFVGTANYFKGLDWEEIQIYPPLKHITWRFNVPSAAWWGGMWERLIRTMKDLMRRMIGKATLRKEELVLVLHSVEESMNNRPLTYVSDNQEDLAPLTPMMFLKPHGDFRFPEGECVEAGKMRIRYKFLQQLKEEIRQRFRKEYLAQLVNRPGRKPNTSIAVGDIVIIEVADKKRIEWPLGRIVQLIPGKDGKTRVAQVKTQNGVLMRPVQRLYPMELTSESQINSQNDQKT